MPNTKFLCKRDHLFPQGTSSPGPGAESLFVGCSTCPTKVHGEPTHGMSPLNMWHIWIVDHVLSVIKNLVYIP